MQQLKVGSSLQGGKYRIENVLGQGGFGITYLATQELLDRNVCIKEFFFKDSCARTSTGEVTLGMVGHKDLVERFLNKFIKEARTISKLEHPNIIRILDIFMENGTAYYVMDFIEGESLEDIVKRRGALPEHEVVGYIKQVANALDYLHQRKINHLDVKPANIMIRKKDNKAILIDFGVSKQYDEQGEQTSTTPVGISYGYAPIEQYRPGGVSEFSPQADIYSLGATLYRLITGITPPQAIEIFNEGLSGLPQSLSSNLASTIRKSMQPHRRSRLQSVNEFLCLLNVPSEQIVEAETTEKIENEFNPEEIDEYHRLAEEGDPIAQINLGNYYIKQNDGASALLWFEKAAEQGSPKAQFNIGFCYELGYYKGIEKDYTKAALWYQKAAEQGGFLSQFRLGRLYFLGWGVQEDYTKAVIWFRKSAEQGYDEAQFFLGLCYDLEQDFVQAVEWYEKAAEQGHEEAIKKLEQQNQSDLEEVSIQKL